MHGCHARRLLCYVVTRTAREYRSQPVLRSPPGVRCVAAASPGSSGGARRRLRTALARASLAQADLGLCAARSRTGWVSAACAGDQAIPQVPCPCRQRLTSELGCTSTPAACLPHSPCTHNQRGAPGSRRLLQEIWWALAGHWAVAQQCMRHSTSTPYIPIQTKNRPNQLRGLASASQTHSRAPSRLPGLDYDRTVQRISGSEHRARLALGELSRITAAHSPASGLSYSVSTR